MIVSAGTSDAGSWTFCGQNAGITTASNRHNSNTDTSLVASSVLALSVGPLVAGTKTTASGKVLANAKIVGLYCTTAGGTQVGVPVVSISGNSVIVTGGALDTSTYVVSLVGWT